MAQKLGNVPVGTILHLKENGVYQDYLVVHQGLPGSMYDASCDGTWILRATIYSVVNGDPGWTSSGIGNNYRTSNIHKTLNSDVLQLFDEDIQNAIKQIKIPYYNGVGSDSGGTGSLATGANGLSCKLFLLSYLEVGETQDTYREVIDGSKLGYFLQGGTNQANKKRIIKYNGVNTGYWLRSTIIRNQLDVCGVSSSGSRLHYQYNAYTLGILPAMVFPADLLVDDNNNILAVTYPTPPTSITVPTSSIPTGSSIAVSWSAVSGAESYRLQRSVDGGAWETVYTGTQTSFSDTAGVWNSVKYQVATVKVGIVSGYTTSSNVTILPYVISRLTVPSQIMEGQSIPISWSAADGATTYILERKVNSGSWTQIYSGANLSYTDTPSGSWSAVQYRVKGGKGGQYGTYKTSASIPVISASALVISGTDGYLGTLTADIAYTVSSDTGNPITVERYVNGQLVATVTVQSGFAYTIPVMDLPTGAGTVKIMASVNTSGGQVSATRTWTYDKKVVLFPDDGGAAQIQVEGKNLMPPTLAECVRVPTVWGGTMDKALELLLPLLSTAVMATGSYTGTGTFGSSSPNTLTFSFTPELVILSGGDVGLTISNTSPSGGTSDAYIQGTTAKWYSTSAAKQLNVQGKSYAYVAIGKAVQA